MEPGQPRLAGLPELLGAGKESRRLDWFDSLRGVRIAELYIPKTIDISASKMREYLIQDDRAAWESYVNPKNHPLYPQLRALALASQENRETQSI